MEIRRARAGFTLIETVVAMGIFVLLTSALADFIQLTFKSNDVVYNQLSAQKDARSALSQMIKEIRNADISSIGAYAVVTSATSTFAFYSDIYADTFRERVRYFVDGTTLKKGVIRPTGTPLTYDSAQETVTVVAHDLIPNSAPFSYFDASYNGSGNPLPDPVDPTAVRFVRITLTIDQKPNVSPAPLTASTEVEIRSLKTY